MKKYFFSFNVCYDQNSKKNIQKLQKQIIKLMQADQQFSKLVITGHNKKQNIVKINKISKLIILNLICSYRYKQGIITSLDNNTLYKRINPKKFREVLDFFAKHDLVKVKKGQFNIQNNKHKRTYIVPTSRFIYLAVTSAYNIKRSTVKCKISRIDNVDKETIITFKNCQTNQQYYYAIADQSKLQAVMNNSQNIFQITYKVEKTEQQQTYNIVQSFNLIYELK